MAQDKLDLNVQKKLDTVEEYKFEPIKATQCYIGKEKDLLHLPSTILPNKKKIMVKKLMVG